MKKNEDPYLINELKSGRTINIALLSHNAYWPKIKKLDNHFENCNVAVTGGSTAYIDDKTLNEFENSDLIIFHSSKYYDEEELKDLENIAIEISRNKSKRVTIGYSYFTSVEQLTNEYLSEQVKIVSFKDEKEIIEEATLENSITAYELIELTLLTADNFEDSKQQLLAKSYK